MGAAMFYHLTRRPMEATLPVLLERSLAQGWRVVVRGAADRLERLDHALWGPEDSFLPHGLAGGPHDALQPVLLTAGTDMTNEPSCLMSVHGAEVDADEVKRLDRVCILFDGHDEAALNVARGQWKALTAAGCSAQYWSEESGRWEKKQER
ncbi:DNA polymerase III subunit chi [Salipiger pallidus]|uniref:DNA polymerase III subunit chi n=1 Tax=Salipiger pallidus TaxID=1775170 RepID=A0A8J3EGR7_9RHOB|nr:DNA polymerase III subunit chi [Salipiger pallidus]GGG75306.1 DNA polymerase III subunit chi [Salipiger pallidus]